MTTKKPPARETIETQGLQDKIRQRAYELYEVRGREDGHDIEDWLQAEEEIVQQEPLSAAA